ncbi:hypothetical protein [Aliihoeflea sp. 40Bstr573]|jgi:hypothetical protein|uniref:hypothetical protein n=1 Tax=Aliihoeflea sp. 40Bstr573 TaxID=2696467 RepID=UPI00209629C5|nr:hypothetical protein [Aliihoeflea sp. 40Bstr573]MCO6389245.1 hypothetical protein [Aliihoeflea sp. 40Bstr573]
MQITNYASGFVSELIRAGNETEQLGTAERARLLQRAACTIRDYRDDINASDAMAFDGTPDDIVYCLEHMAERVDDFAVHEIAEALLEAAEAVKVGRILVDAKQEMKARGIVT